MITGSNLFGLAVTYRTRLIQFSKLIYATVVLKVLLHNHNLEGIAWDDVITYISAMVELRRFLPVILMGGHFNFWSLPKG